MNEAGKAKVGLLPLMLEMYKEFSPDMLKRQQPFIGKVAKKLGNYVEAVSYTHLTLPTSDLV